MADAAHTLIVEDEPDMARVLEYNLSQQGYSTFVTTNCRDALAQARTAPPALILLDVRLQDGSGLDVLRQLKADSRTAPVPVVVVSAIGDEGTVVEALNLGAEDYVAKPVRIQELLARVAAILRRPRTPVPAAAMLSVGALSLDLQARRATVDGTPIELTRTEFDLLAQFLRHPGRVFTRQQFCESLGAGGSVQERTIDAHVRTLRRKLGPTGKVLMTVWGVGYRLAEDGELGKGC